MSKTATAPWRYDSAPGFCAEINDATGNLVCSFCDDPTPEHGALMAAAPDLLQALVAAARNAEDGAFNEWVDRACPHGGVDAVQHQWEDSRQYLEYCDAWRVQLDAIRKARGEQ